jgi:hypothetical protein
VDVIHGVLVRPAQQFLITELCVAFVLLRQQHITFQDTTGSSLQ